MRTVTQTETVEFALPRRKNVAAYARVSDDTERLAHSMSMQVEYYRNVILAQKGWVLAGIYTDEYVSGTQVRNREGFQRLLADCERGLIDIVLCKSLSRFGRNTVDLLEAIRRLRDIGVEVRFEKENINTLSEDGELMLTLLASFAQEESRSISENIKWGIKKRFENGLTNHFVLYGYRWTGTEFVIVPEEAMVVKRVFDSYLKGKSAEVISRELEHDGVRTAKGFMFRPTRLRAMLENISYTGTDLLHKEYINDHITHKRKKNNGEKDMFLVENARPEIISREIFEKVQNEINRRREGGKLANPAAKNWHPLSCKISCGICGATFSRHRKRTKNGDHYTWMCGTKCQKGACACPVPNIREEVLLEFISMATGSAEPELEKLKYEIKKITISPEIKIIEFMDNRIYKEERK